MYICTSICKALLCVALCCRKKWWQLSQAEMASQDLLCGHYNTFSYKPTLPKWMQVFQLFLWQRTDSAHWSSVSSDKTTDTWGTDLLSTAEGIWQRWGSVELCFNSHLKWVWTDSITNQLAVSQLRNYSVCCVFWKVAFASADRQLPQNKRKT